ncbi:MAG: tetratricopeptide repeat protein, partial [Planctomycetes bacterium]|nr:tetratricopeptide repeat protein [Planctomycetota bacterium]
LIAGAETRAKGEKLLSAAVAYLRKNMPSDTSEPGPKSVAKAYWFHIVGLYATAGQEKKVTETYEQIMKTLGVDDEILGHLAGWHKSQGNYEEARRTYRRFADKINGLSQVASSYQQEGNLELAVKTFRELMGQDPDGKIRWSSAIASAYFHARKYDEAITAYKELMALDPEHSEGWRWNIAQAYHHGGRHKEAIGWYRQCTNFPRNYEEMASCHRQMKQYREALALYAQIAGGSQDRAPWAMLQIALTREQAGEKEAAIKAFQIVCKRFPKDSHASQAHVHLQSKYNISITLGGAKDE